MDCRRQAAILTVVSDRDMRLRAQFWNAQMVRYRGAFYDNAYSLSPNNKKTEISARLEFLTVFHGNLGTDRIGTSPQFFTVPLSIFRSFLPVFSSADRVSVHLDL